MIDKHELIQYLNHKVSKYNNKHFIDTDPVSIPHIFTNKNDIEIAGFLSAAIAWGQRKAILKSANKLVNLMDNAPYDFIINAADTDLKPFGNFVYRTFNGSDCIFFLKSIKNIYQNHGGFEQVFTTGYKVHGTIKGAISHFRDIFLTTPHPVRSCKHLANPEAGSAAKRVNMYLRWMVRNDKSGVDFGVWKNIPVAQLMIPLDVHSGNIARQLGLLSRKQNDWRAVEELTQNLRHFDANDPVKYDFALFGVGVNNDL